MQYPLGEHEREQIAPRQEKTCGDHAGCSDEKPDCPG